MFIVTNLDNEIIDISSRLENINPLHILHNTNHYKVSNQESYMLGDYYDGKDFTHNDDRRAAKYKEHLECEMIENEIKRLACQNLHLSTRVVKHTNKIVDIRTKLEF